MTEVLFFQLPTLSRGKMKHQAVQIMYPSTDIILFYKSFLDYLDVNSCNLLGFQKDFSS